MRSTHECSARPRRAKALLIGLLLAAAWGESATGDGGVDAATMGDAAATDAGSMQDGALAAPDAAGVTVATCIPTDPNAVYSVPMSAGKPGYLVPFTDPTFCTKIVRIGGDPGSTFTAQNGSGTWGVFAQHHYTNDEPWNADGSLLALQNLNNDGSDANPSLVLLDGNTYVPKYVKCPQYDLGDDRWHPSLAHKNERINVSGKKLEWFDVVSCVQTRAWTLPIDGDNDFGQNPDASGRFAVVDSGTQLAVVDMDPQPPYAPYPSQRIGPVLTYDPGCPLASCTSGHVSISPDAAFVILHYDSDHNQIFDINPASLALTPHVEATSTSVCSGAVSASSGGVYDLGHDNPLLNFDDGNQAYDVGQHRSSCSDGAGGFAGVRLSDGKVVVFTPGSNLAYPYHASTMNSGRPGWFFGSFYPGAGQRFSDEIDAFRTDGSGTVERLAHDHTDTSANCGNCYRYESHPVPSRDGLRVVFASGWQFACAGATCGSASGGAQAYVIDLRGP